MKYLVATGLLVFALWLGWFISARYLDPLIFMLFTPDSHDSYLNIWFAMFAAIELVILLIYLTFVYRLYRA